MSGRRALPYKNIVAVACLLFGKKTYQAFVLFLLSIYARILQHEGTKGQRPLFVVFLTRRCHVLKDIFFPIFKSPLFRKQVEDGWFDLAGMGLTWKDLEPETIDRVYSTYFITDFAFLSMSRDFAKYYKKTGELPECIIADELLIHGRAMNKLLRDMENGLAEAFCALMEHDFAEPASEPQRTQWKEEIRSAFLERVHLRVFAQKEGTILLFSRYAQGERLSSHRYSGSQWRSLSLRFARLVAAAAVNNVGFSWSFFPPVSKCPFLKERFNAGESMWIPNVEDAPQPLQFYGLRTYLNRIPLQHEIYLHTTGNVLKAVFSIRIKKSMTLRDGTRRLLMVPYLMTGKVPCQNIWNLFRRLKRELAGEGKDPALRAFLDLRPDGLPPEEEKAAAVCSYDRLCGINNLILCSALVKEFWPSFERDRAVLEEIDWRQIGSNYKRFDPESGEPQDQEKALRAIWEWKPEAPLQEYLEILLENAEGLALPEGVFHPMEEQGEEQLERIVLNVVSQLGLKAESNAHQREASDVPFNEELLTSWGEQDSILDVIAQCLGQYRAREQTEADLYRTVAEIVHAMDLGVVGMNTSLEAPEEAYTMVKAGEQALFVKPMRYRRLIPLFCKLERKYAGDEGALLREIRSFAQTYAEVILKKEDGLLCSGAGDSEQEAEALAEELSSFVEELHASGQTVSDWDFSLSEQMDQEDFDFLEHLMEDLAVRDQYLQLYDQM